MSKFLPLFVASLLALPFAGSPAIAAKNIGVGAGAGTTRAISTCTTIQVPVWQCPKGDSPSNWPNTNCKLVLVPQTVCHAA